MLGRWRRGFEVEGGPERVHTTEPKPNPPFVRSFVQHGPHTVLSAAVSRAQRLPHGFA